MASRRTCSFLSRSSRIARSFARFSSSIYPPKVRGRGKGYPGPVVAYFSSLGTKGPPASASYSSFTPSSCSLRIRSRSSSPAISSRASSSRRLRVRSSMFHSICLPFRVGTGAARSVTPVRLVKVALGWPFSPGPLHLCVSGVHRCHERAHDGVALPTRQLPAEGLRRHVAQQAIGVEERVREHGRPGAGVQVLYPLRFSQYAPPPHDLSPEGCPEEFLLQLVARILRLAGKVARRILLERHLVPPLRHGQGGA